MAQQRKKNCTYAPVRIVTGTGGSCSSTCSVAELAAWKSSKSQRVGISLSSSLEAASPASSVVAAAFIAEKSVVGGGVLLRKVHNTVTAWCLVALDVG